MISRDDFETPMDRRNSGLRKWDVVSGELPMTTADMGFRAAPDIVAALAGRVRRRRLRLRAGGGRVL